MGMCLQQWYHLALTVSCCVFLYFISYGAISVLQWEVCFTHSIAKRKECPLWTVRCGGGKTVRNSAPSSLLRLRHGSVEGLSAFEAACLWVQILLGCCWNLTALITSRSLAFHKLSRCGVTVASGKIPAQSIICSFLEVFYRVRVGLWKKGRHPPDGFTQSL